MLSEAKYVIGKAVSRGHDEDGTLESKLFEQLLKTKRLPTPSAAALRILDLTDRDDASPVEVADALSSDPALAARLLKFANSAELGAVNDVTSVRQAVMRLGLRSVKVTALSFSLISDRDSAKCPGFEHNLFWAHSLATAVATRAVIQRGASVTQEEGFTAGLMSQLGKLVLAVGAPEQYQQVLAQAPNVLKTTPHQERDVLGADSAEIGSSLLERWKLPALIVQAIRNQLTPRHVDDPKVRFLAECLLAGRIVADYLCDVSCDMEGLLAFAGAGRTVPTTMDALPEWLKGIESGFRETATILAIPLDDLPDAAEIQSRAADKIAELSMVAEAENQTIQAENRVLEQQATTDPLTGVLNRAAFDRQFASEMERTRRYGRPLTLILLDVDHFKKFNDSYGHLVGDGVLRLVADTCGQTIRNCDFLARYGGEEFAVIAPETNLQQSAFLAERIRQAVECQAFTHEDQPLNVTVSLGVASLTDIADGVTPGQIIKAADVALYQAKRSGRNRCCFAQTPAVDKAVSRVPAMV